MEDITCRKCGNTGLQPRWHKAGYKTGVDTLTTVIVSCDTKDTSKTEEEHLHYYCKCGYDFVTPVSELMDGGFS